MHFVEKNKIFFVWILFWVFLINTAHAGIILEDGFESRDMSTTNSDGFSWSANNRTSIVTMDPEDGSVAVYNNGPVYTIAIPTKDWYAKTGDYSLRFRYPAGEAWAEQRFTIGRNYQEIWFSYWIRVPLNFSYPGSGLNNKWFAVWTGSDGYDKHGDVTWQLRGNGSGANIVYQDGGVLSGETGSTPFISTDDQGRWMNVVYQIVSASSLSAEDGIIRFYRKWLGDSNYLLIHEKLNANTYNPEEIIQGISHGYIMGWANAAYAEETEWLIDDFIVSTTSLLEPSSPSSPTGLSVI